MKRLSRLIIGNNIFKESFLRHIFLISIGLAIILPLYCVLFIYPSFNNLITEDKKEEAIGIANHLSSFLPANATELGNMEIDYLVHNEILEHINHFSLVKLKIFSRKGEVIYSTDKGDVGKINNNRYFQEIIAKGKSLATIIASNSQSLEGQRIGAEVVETYVPLMKDNTFFGAMEIYYNITARREQLNKLLTHSTVMLFGLAGGFLTIVVLVLFRANRTITERSRIEQEREKSLSLLEATLESTTDGILAVDNEGNMVSFNQKFVEMWGIPESIVSSREDDKALEFVLDQLKQPDVFLTKVRELYSQPEAESYDTLEFKDGRIFERYSQPQRSGEEIFGRVWSFRDVTERVNSERALRKSEQTMKGIIQASPLPLIAVSSEGKVTMWNAAAKRIFGWEEHEVLGKAYPLIPPGEEEVSLDLRKRAFAGERFTGFELIRRKKDGTLIEVSISTAPVFDRNGNIENIMAVLEDITQRKQVEEELIKARNNLEQRVQKRTHALTEANEKLRREIEERKRAEEEIHKGKTMLQAVFDGISEPLLMLDRNQCLRMMNEAALIYYQVATLEDMISKPCRDMIQRESSACDLCGVPSSYLDGNRVSFERKGLFDSNRLEHVVIYPIREGSAEVTGCILRISDVTDQKRLEEQLIRADRLSSLGQLSGGIAHEIRNPLSGISLFVDILSDEEQFERTDNEYEIFAEIKGNINKIDSIIRRILDFARATEIESTRIDLNNLIEENLKLWYGKMRNAHIRLQLSLDRDLPPFWGDAIGIQQVLNNLVQNAVEAMPDGGVLHIATQNGLSSFHEGRPVVEILVKDTGSGVAPDIGQKIFDPFFTTKSTGTGLGLSISHQIVDRHGGILSVDSKPGEETTFGVELPVSGGE